ncbi:MAG: PHP domain-containing protein [Longicatena sp.]
MNTVDLHIHSEYSDGSCSVDEILDIVEEKGMYAFSITDHDTFAVYEELKNKKFSGQLIKGIELSCVDTRTQKDVHILGYCLPEKTEHIDILCAKTRERLHEKALWQIQQLRAHEYEITVEEVQQYAKKSGTIYKQHILQVLVDKGYCDELYAPLYQTLFKNFGICQKEMEYPSVKEVIEAIHEDGGIAILAHPYQSHVEEELLRFYELGINGIEVYHSSHNKEQVEYLHAFAKNYHLLQTGGSDFHGKYGKEPMIGEVQSEWRSEEHCLCKMKYWKAQYYL